MQQSFESKPWPRHCSISGSDECPSERGCSPRKSASCQGNRNFLSFWTETFGIIAFFFFGTAMFWVLVTTYLIEFAKTIYRMGRYAQIAALLMMLLLIVSLTLRVHMHNKQYEAKDKVQTKVVIVKAPKSNGGCMKIAFKDGGIARSQQNATKMKEKHFTMTISDEKRNELYRSSKKFAIPADWAREMKQPPALIVYFKDVLIDNYS